MNAAGMPPSSLLWLDAAPWHYWLTGWTAFAAAAVTALWAGNGETTPGRRRAGDLWFAFIILATLAAFRWPGWFSRDEFNPDESQIVAGAITLREHPVFWKYVDAGTHGPVSEFLLVLASWLGAPLNYPTARMAAIGLQALSLIAVWRTLRPFTTEQVARCSVLPGLAFWSLISWVDFIHYGTELPGIALLALAAWAVVKPLCSASTDRRGWLRLFLGGFALGLIPLTKLQQIPLGGMLFLIVVIFFGARQWRGRSPGAGRALAWFFAGGLTPLLGLVIYLGIFGLAAQFWVSYIASGLAYTAAGQHPFVEMPGWFFHFSATAFGFAWFFWGSLAFCLLYARSACPPTVRVARHLGWGMLAVALFCVLRPSREVAHYLHILVIPLTTLGGLVLAGAVHERSGGRWARSGPVAAFLLLTVVPQVQHSAVAGNVYLGRLRENFAKPDSAAAQFVRQHRHDSDTLAVWGWEPRLFVDTGMAMGTRDAATGFVNMQPGPAKSFYVDRYVRDLTTRRPTWFVDAVGPGAFFYEDRHVYGHESIGPVRDLISHDYELLADIDSKRIYRLKAAGTP